MQKRHQSQTEKLHANADKIDWIAIDLEPALGSSETIGYLNGVLVHQGIDGIKPISLAQSIKMIVKRLMTASDQTNPRSKVAKEKWGKQIEKALAKECGQFAFSDN